MVVTKPTRSVGRRFRVATTGAFIVFATLGSWSEAQAAASPPSVAANLQADPSNFIKTVSSNGGDVATSVALAMTSFPYLTANAQDVASFINALKAVASAAGAADKSSGNNVEQTALGIGLARAAKSIMEPASLAKLSPAEQVAAQTFVGQVQTLVAGLGQASPIALAYITEDRSTRIASVAPPQSAVFGSAGDGKAGVVITNDTPSGGSNTGTPKDSSDATTTQSSGLGSGTSVSAGLTTSPTTGTTVVP